MTPGKKGPRGAKSQGSRSKKELSFTRPKMNRDQIKAAGEEAANVLNSTVYNIAINSIVDDLGLMIMQTEPHETQKREWLYSQGAAVGRINQKMVEFVQLAQSLHMEELAAEEAAQRERDADQGFAGVSEIDNPM